MEYCRKKWEGMVKSMKWIYPMLSKWDLGVFRIGGAGIGNILFPYSRALVESKKYNIPLIWPTWPSMKLGPYIRKEQDKRGYWDLFENNNGSIDGIRKLFLLSRFPKICREDIDDINQVDNCIIVYSGEGNLFNDILAMHDVIRKDLIINLKRREEVYDFSRSINVHIRMGDFGQISMDNIELDNYCNVRIPLEWYEGIITQLSESLGRNIVFNVFSDADNLELDRILGISNVRRVMFGNGILDILAMGEAKLVISPGNSTFSQWGIFLGQCNSIVHNKRWGDTLSSGGKETIEIETRKGLSEDQLRSIKNLYNM